MEKAIYNIFFFKKYKKLLGEKKIFSDLKITEEIKQIEVQTSYE